MNDLLRTITDEDFETDPYLKGLLEAKEKKVKPSEYNEVKEKFTIYAGEVDIEKDSDEIVRRLTSKHDVEKMKKKGIKDKNLIKHYNEPVENEIKTFYGLAKDLDYDSFINIINLDGILSAVYCKLDLHIEEINEV